MSGAAVSHLPVVVSATLDDWLMFAPVLAAMIWLGGWAIARHLPPRPFVGHDLQTLNPKGRTRCQSYRAAPPHGGPQESRPPSDGLADPGSQPAGPWAPAAPSPL